jgi:cell division protein FtsI/penicillin-binding protein 2
MYMVVNDGGGTGRYHDIEHVGEHIGMVFSAKTGSAQAAPLRRPKIDPETGKQSVITETVPVVNPLTKVISMEERKRLEWESLELGTHAHPNPIAPWYRGSGAAEDKISHAWYIGYAPSDHPKIAFAVVVYYGGGGGSTAGWVAKGVLEELIKHKYLQKQS